ncbi:hypothetical protein BPIT_28520 [Candidatus Brocadia pituitae]|nr:hypothetical protein BPIT_28520 [Candidatus Brocadia pituitae]
MGIADLEEMDCEKYFGHEGTKTLRVQGSGFRVFLRGTEVSKKWLFRHKGRSRKSVSRTPNAIVQQSRNQKEVHHKAHKVLHKGHKEKLTKKRSFYTVIL